MEYKLPFDTNLTKEAGEIEVKITFSKVDLDEDGNDIQYVRKIEFPIRKLAHATEYTILGILMSLFFFSWNRKRYGLYGSLWGILYAITDELHQAFVPGRSCQMTDVAIDSLGCLFGCTVIALFMSIRRKR